MIFFFLIDSSTPKAFPGEDHTVVGPLPPYFPVSSLAARSIYLNRFRPSTSGLVSLIFSLAWGSEHHLPVSICDPRPEGRTNVGQSPPLEVISLIPPVVSRSTTSSAFPATPKQKQNTHTPYVVNSRSLEHVEN